MHTGAPRTPTRAAVSLATKRPRGVEAPQPRWSISTTRYDSGSKKRLRFVRAEGT
jgi:hypothetical protein